MAGEQLHAPRERLRQKTLTLHHALSSVVEELEAIDWYAQRADDTSDEQLKAILLHNMEEEVEHACMALEWLRRNSPEFAENMKTYLFTEGDITAVEEQATGGESGDGESEGGESEAGDPAAASASDADTLTVGGMKQK